jgi:RND family efflux transporter MFP subunit
MEMTDQSIRKRCAIRLLAAAGLLLAINLPARASDFAVMEQATADEKAVFATVESASVVPARARIGGTIMNLAIREGDSVKGGQVVATIVDEKLALQMNSLDAQIAALQAQVAKSKADLARIEPLASSGVVSRSQLDTARTALDVAQNGLAAQVAQKSVLQQQMSEGDVLAPADGRVLTVPLTKGSVVMPGDAIATIADGRLVLRLRVPERHARFLAAGDRIRIDGTEFGVTAPLFGLVTLVYPQIEDGRVVADAKVEGLNPYFVGERIRVWVSGGTRESYVVPASYVFTHFGVDYVLLAEPGGGAIQAPVQRGRAAPTPEMPDGIEILSGLKTGDRLVQP